VLVDGFLVLDEAGLGVKGRPETERGVLRVNGEACASNSTFSWTIALVCLDGLSSESTMSSAMLAVLLMTSPASGRILYSYGFSGSGLMVV